MEKKKRNRHFLLDVSNRRTEKRYDRVRHDRSSEKISIVVSIARRKPILSIAARQVEVFSVHVVCNVRLTLRR